MKNNSGRKRKMSKGFRRMTFYVMIIFLVFILSGIQVIPQRAPLYWEVYTVSQGDTLWTIAKDLPIENSDIRRIVAEISQVNDLDNVELYPGDQILVPVIKD